MITIQRWASSLGIIARNYAEALTALEWKLDPVSAVSEVWTGT